MLLRISQKTSRNSVPRPIEIKASIRVWWYQSAKFPIAKSRTSRLLDDFFAFEERNTQLRSNPIEIFGYSFHPRPNLRVSLGAGEGYMENS